MSCQSSDVFEIIKGKNEVRKVQVQFPLNNGGYPIEPPVFLHNTAGFGIGAIDYDDVTGLATFNLLSSTVLFDDVVRFVATAKYANNELLTWREFIVVEVIDDSQFIYSSPVIYRLKAESALMFDAQAMLSIDYRISVAQNLLLDAYASVLLSQAIAGQANFIITAHAMVGVLIGLTQNTHIMLEAFGQVAINRGLGGSGLLSLDAFADLTVTTITGLTGLITYHDVDASDTVTTQVNQTFTSANVDTGTGNINLNLGFTYAVPDIETAGVSRVGVPVYFSSTGTMPSIVGGGTLQPNTRYYAINNATNTQLELYPEASGTYVDGLHRYVPFKKLLPCVFLYAGAKKIMLANGGTGTHTIFTNPLCNLVTNKAGFATPLKNTDTNPNSKIEILTDSDGVKYLNIAGNLAEITSVTTVHGNGIGKKMDTAFDEVGNKTPFRERFANKRYIVMSNVCYVDDEPIFDLRKAIVIPPVTGTYTQIQTGTYQQNGNATVTVDLPLHGLSQGQSIVVTSVASGTTATGTFTIQTVPTENTFTYTSSSSQTTSGSLTFNGRAVVVTNSNHGFLVGQTVYVTATTGTPATATGTFTVTKVRNANTFTYTASTTQGANGNITVGGIQINASTGVFTTPLGHGFPVGTATNGFTEVTVTKPSWSTLPQGLAVYNGLTTPSRNTVWLRGITSTTFSLHPTYADCKANTNAITYTTGSLTGSGEFYIAMYAGLASKPEEHYFGSLDYPIQWLIGSLNGTGAQRFINQTINTGMYASSIHGITNAEIASMTSTYGAGGLCNSATKGIAGMFTTGSSGKDGTFIATTLPLRAYPVRIKMAYNAVYPYCTTLGRRLTNADSFWGVPYPTGSSTRGWLFQNKADADAFVATSPTTSSNPSNALVLDNAQYDFSNPSANNGFYGQYLWYMGTNESGFDTGLIGTSNVIPAHTIMPMFPLRKKVVLTTILDLYNQNTTALKTCGVQLTSVTVGERYSVTVNGTTFFYDAQAGNTTTNVLDALVTAINVAGVGEGRKNSTMMHIWSTTTTGTFSLSVSSNLTIRTFIRYKIYCNGTQVTTDWEDYNNSDIRYIELLQSGNYVDSPTSDPLYAPCQLLYGSPAQPHVGFFGRLYAAIIAASNTNPETQFLTETLPLLMSRYKVPA
jgi:hypothetical protein